MLGRTKKLVTVAAVAVGVLSTATFAATPRYETRRMSMGPRPDQYVLVRTDHEKRSSASYALTGRPVVKYERKLVQRWSGGRYVGPVWVTERVAE